jgi:hypothetical protein
MLRLPEDKLAKLENLPKSNARLEIGEQLTEK